MQRKWILSLTLASTHFTFPLRFSELIAAFHRKKNEKHTNAHTHTPPHTVQFTIPQSLNTKYSKCIANQLQTKTESRNRCSKTIIPKNHGTKLAKATNIAHPFYVGGIGKGWCFRSNNKTRTRKGMQNKTLFALSRFWILVGVCWTKEINYDMETKRTQVNEI